MRSFACGRCYQGSRTLLSRIEQRESEPIAVEFNRDFGLSGGAAARQSAMLDGA